MEAIRQYLISITAAAILCGIIKCLFPEKGGAGVMIRVMAGLFLTATVIAPLAKVSLVSWNDFTGTLDSDAREAVATGENAVRESLRESIKTQVEAYILDKADSFGAELTVEVTLCPEDPPLPERVVLNGSISPYGRSRLESIMTEDLGIAKEQIIWTG